MAVTRRGFVRIFVFLPFVLLVLAGTSMAQTPVRAINGTVFNPIQEPLTGASVTLLRDAKEVSSIQSDAQGKFTFSNLAEARYQLRVSSTGFAEQTLDPFFVNAAVTINVTLQVGLNQNVVVTASSEAVPTSQIGSAVTVIGHDTMDALAKPDVLESLRLTPGINVVQTGARGGSTSIFVRGGEADFNKVLIDGVAANDIGGAFDFGAVTTTGVDRVEVLRNPNSVIYGSDALAGVIDLTTKKGTTRIPEISFTADGGRFDSSRQSASIGGANRRFDYFVDLGHFQTDNSVPNNAYRNLTLASRFGVALSSHSNLTFTVRRMTSSFGSPNGIDLYGIADDSTQKADATYVSATYEGQINSRWTSTMRFGSMEQGFHSVNPTPTGEPFDPFGFGPNYLGSPVTLTGANGDSVTGQGILDFGGDYPSDFDTSTKRQTASGQIAGRVAHWLDLTFGGRTDHEDGFTLFDGSKSATTRVNGGAFAEGRVTLPRTFVTAGLGYDHNAIFKSAVSPRVTAAVYVSNPSSSRRVGATKLTMNAGAGIKAPSIAQELSSLFTVVQSASAAAAQNVSPIGPERNRSFDVGIEQSLWHNKVQARAAWFDNSFSNLIEFVDADILPQLGVPVAAAAATGFGAYVNSSSYRARGVETSAELSVGAYLKISGWYTHLHAVVTKSFASGDLAPAINPAFPGIAIGQFGPLVGAAPFRRPANTGSLLVQFTRGRAQAAITGFFSGKSDDSTFIEDGFFGNSMLLPNHDLNAAYQKVDVSASFQVHPRVRWYVTVENVLDQRNNGAFGFPALPRSFRTGTTIVLGGDHRP